MTPSSHSLWAYAFEVLNVRAPNSPERTQPQPSIPGEGTDTKSNEVASDGKGEAAGQVPEGEKDGAEGREVLALQADDAVSICSIRVARQYNRRSDSFASFF